jgi:hypothetical protein
MACTSETWALSAKPIVGALSATTVPPEVHAEVLEVPLSEKVSGPVTVMVCAGLQIVGVLGSDDDWRGGGRASDLDERAADRGVELGGDGPLDPLGEDVEKLGGEGGLTALQLEGAQHGFEAGVVAGGNGREG